MNNWQDVNHNALATIPGAVLRTGALGAKKILSIMIPQRQAAMMRIVMFWVFISLFVIVVLATLALIFFGLGSPTPEERSWLFKVFIIEVGVAVVALFYSLFGLRKDVAPSEGERLKGDMDDKLNAKMREVDAKVEHATSGILMVQGDIESSQCKHADAAISFMHASTHAVRSGDASLMHEVFKELLDVKLPAVTKKDWSDSEELRNDMSRLIDDLPGLCKADDIAYVIRGLREFRAKIAT